jgi:hypothetical protein
MEEHKNQRFKIAFSHLKRFKEERNELLESMVTSNEPWVHHFSLQTKQAGMQWEHPTSLKAKRFKVSHSAGKFMASVFWDVNGIIHVEFMPQAMTTNVMLTATQCDDCMRLYAGRDLDICQEG